MTRIFYMEIYFVIHLHKYRLKNLEEKVPDKVEECIFDRFMELRWALDSTHYSFTLKIVLGSLFTKS